MGHMRTPERGCLGASKPLPAGGRTSRWRWRATGVWLAVATPALVLSAAVRAAGSSTVATVNWARDNGTGTNYPDGSWPVLALNNLDSGPGNRVWVDDVPANWWEAHYTDPCPAIVPDGSTLLSVVVTVQYEMVSSGWNGTLTLEALAASTPKSLGTTDLPEHAVVTQETWDITALVNREADPLATLNDLGIRMINNDPADYVPVRWSYTKVDVQYDRSPGFFDLLAPTDGEPGVALTPTLDWDDSANAVSYSLVVSKNPDFSAPVIDQAGIASNTYGVVSALDPTTTYYWRVTAVNAFGTRQCNSDFSFTTLPADLHVSLIDPSDVNPDVGDVVSVDVTVQNLGNAAVGPFTVGLFYDRATAPSVGATPDTTEPVASLGPLSSTVVQFTGIAGTKLETWNMYALVDSNDDVPESDEANNAKGPIAVAWHGPDLVIPSIAPSDANPDAGQDVIEVRLTVLNLGDRDAGPFNVTLFYDEAAAPSVGDVPPPPKGQTQGVAALAAGPTPVVVTFTGIQSNVADGWQTWAIVDNKAVPAGGDVIEVDETNNVGGPAGIAWQPLPDLVVNSVVPVDGEPDVGETISVDVQIANTGLANAGGFWVGLYYNLPAPPTAADTPDRSVYLPLVIPPGGQRNLTFGDITSATLEIWNMYVAIDYEGVVEESNEANNAYGPVHVNWGAVTDLVVVTPNGDEIWESGTTQQIMWKTYGSIVGVTVGIDYTTTGGAPWTPIEASWPDDGVYDWDLPAADSSLCLVRVRSGAGSYEDESDNTFTILPAGVARPNLRVVSIVPSDASPGGSDKIDVNVTVRNVGTAASGLFFVDLYLDRSTAPSAGEIGDLSKSELGLADGTQVTVPFTGLSSRLAGLWSMYAAVDTQGYVTETNEGDNVAGPELVTWRRFWVMWPNGGEVLEPGKTYAVSWTSTLDRAEPVDIELSVNGGVTWATVERGIPNSGYYVWTVPALESDVCRLRIGDSAGTIADESNGFFGLQVNLKGFYGSACGAPGAGPLVDDPVMLQWLVLLAGLAFLRRLLSRRSVGEGS